MAESTTNKGLLHCWTHTYEVVLCNCDCTRAAATQAVNCHGQHPLTAEDTPPCCCIIPTLGKI